MELLLSFTALFIGLSISYNSCAVSIARSYSENSVMDEMSTSFLGVLVRLISYFSGYLVGAHVTLVHGANIGLALSASFVFLGAALFIQAYECSLFIQAYECWPFGFIYLIACFSLDFGVSMGKLCGPIYMAQCSRKDNTGKLITLIGDTFRIGYLICSGLETYFVSVKFPDRWQALVFSGCLFPLLQLVTIMRIPDPPETNDSEDANIKCLLLSVFIRGIRTSNFRRGLLACTACQLAKQIVCVDTILYLQPKLPFKNQKNLGNLIICQIIGSIINIMLVDRFKSKKLLQIGLCLLSSTLILLGFAFSLDLTQGPVLYILVSVYLSIYSTSFGQLPEIASNKYFAENFRVVGATFTSLSASVFSIGISLTFKSLEDAIGTANTFYLSAASGIVALVFLEIFLPETYGLTPEAASDTQRALP